MIWVPCFPYLIQIITSLLIIKDYREPKDNLTKHTQIKNKKIKNQNQKPS